MFGRPHLEFHFERKDYGRIYGLFAISESPFGKDGKHEVFSFQKIGEISLNTCWSGNEHVEQLLSDYEVQNLMNALWKVGVRPAFGDRE